MLKRMCIHFCMLMLFAHTMCCFCIHVCLCLLVRVPVAFSGVCALRWQVNCVCVCTQMVSAVWVYVCICLQMVNVLQVYVLALKWWAYWACVCVFALGRWVRCELRLWVCTKMVSVLWVSMRPHSNGKCSVSVCCCCCCTLHSHKTTSHHRHMHCAF